MDDVITRLKFLKEMLNRINGIENRDERMYQIYSAYNELIKIFSIPIKYTEDEKELGKGVLELIFWIINRSPNNNELIFIPNILRGMLENKFENLYIDDNDYSILGHELDSLIDVTNKALEIFEDYLYGIQSTDYYRNNLMILIHKADPISSDELTVDYVRYIVSTMSARLEEEGILNLDEYIKGYYETSIRKDMKTFGIYRKEPLSKEELDKKITEHIIKRTRELTEIKNKSKNTEKAIDDLEYIINKCKKCSWADNIMLNGSMVIENIEDIQKALDKIKELIK
jgi:hypothetical protein